MRVAVTGSTGLIGEALVDALRRDGHEPIRVVRSRERATGQAVYWSVERDEIDAAGLEGLDAVVHLAGEPIGARRWTPEVKRAIRDSREQGTALLAGALASLDDPPAVLVSQSAVDYYGDRGSAILTEDAPPGDSFLSEVCVAWERATAPASEAGIRVVTPRSGVAIAWEGPLMQKLRLPFLLGVGGPVGSGDQFLPWISLTDVVRGLEFLLTTDLDGPVNLTAPAPVTNAEFARSLGRVLRRPALLPVPVFALRLLYGQMGVVLGTHSKRAVPRRLLDAGFSFQHPDLNGALRAELQ